MKIISLGGIGGCELAHALRKLDQPTYPYDWLITTQSFILDSFNDFNRFFTFDTEYVHDSTLLIMHNKKGIMLHDFDNFNLQKEEVIAKYKRRFERLDNALHEKEDILFVRIYDNLQEKLIPTDYYNDILIRDKEDIPKWNHFIEDIQMKYNKKTKLLIITDQEDIVSNNDSNIIVHFTKEHKEYNNIYNIIQEIIK